MIPHYQIVIPRLSGVLGFGLEIPRISYMSTPLFDTGFIGLEVLDLVQSIIENSSQSYEGY